MSVDKEIVQHIAHMARVTLPQDEKQSMCEEINALLAFDEQLNEVDIEEVEPLVNVISETLKMRKDEVTIGNQAEAILANAPLAEENFFLVPKVVD